MNPHPESEDDSLTSKVSLDRAAGDRVKLSIARFAGSLALASVVTLTLLGGMVFALSLALFLIYSNLPPNTSLILAIASSVGFNLLAFLLTPWLMDATQSYLYQTRWVKLSEIAQRNPEAAQVIRQVCAQKGIKQPRLGIIQDQNPTAFTYGSLPSSARLVVSEGLFTYLNDDEIAAVYAHEMGHIVHWDFAIMTLGSTLVQISYLIYSILQGTVYTGTSKSKDIGGTIASAAYVFYLVGTYLLLYLSRVREYFADHFAAEVTGNPNALSRGLVKIAYGLVEEGKRSKQPSRLMEGTRALGIYDSKTAVMTGSAYRISADPERVGQVFLWDMFSPWAWWIELSSTHPLTGKRIRALTNYAEQLGLSVEFDMAQVVRDGKTLSKKRLFGSFFLDLLFFWSELLGFMLGLWAGLAWNSTSHKFIAVIACPLMGWGIGILVKALVMFPNYAQAQSSDVLTLMADPYASPLRGKPVHLQGKMIGRGDAGYVLGSDLQFQDQTGLLFLRYASRFGALGNLMFGMKRVNRLIGNQGTVLGWFRRGAASYMDLIQFQTESGTKIKSYHRFWSFVYSLGLIALGLFLIK